MSTLLFSLLVAGCIIAGGVIGLNLHRILPRHHLTKEALDVIKLGTGMLSVLASLVLGLLIATAKSSHDSTEQAVQSYAAELALLNEVLRDYGAPATGARDLRHNYVERFMADTWRRDGGPSELGLDPGPRRMLEHVRETIRAFKPADAGQTSLQNEALGISTALLRQRLLLIEHQGPNVQIVVIGILVSWIIVIFVSFGMNAPYNATVLAAFLICSLAIGASIFLILEMDRPLEGMMRISKEPVALVLSQMNW
ncbi:MAG: hypothetical protein ACJ8AW_34745 [Rhodopila sp.]